MRERESDAERKKSVYANKALTYIFMLEETQHFQFPEYTFR
jgi:hypothetical protein